MNDFTKEELEIIIEAMDRVVEFITIWQEPKHFDVISKIKSLIDNYCDHKKTYQDSCLLTFCDDCNEVVK